MDGAPSRTMTRKAPNYRLLSMFWRPPELDSDSLRTRIFGICEYRHYWLDDFAGYISKYPCRRSLTRFTPDSRRCHLDKARAHCGRSQRERHCH
jgi:hypothetical protein